MPKIDLEALGDYVAAAPARQEALTDLAAQNAAANTATIAALQNLGVGQTSVNTTTLAGILAASNRPEPAPAPTPAPATKPINQMTPEELAAYQRERVARQREYRETGGGTNPPYEAPEGQYWSFSSGQWKLYKKTTPTSSTNSNTSGNAGGNTSDNTGGSNAPEVTLVNTNVDPNTGAVIGYFSDGSSKTLTAGGLSKVETDAYALLEDTFRNYGLEELVPLIQTYMKQNLGTEQATLQLKQSKPYQTRFAGNQIRLAQGQNALSEAAYLALENDYIDTLNAYGLKNFFGTDRTSQVANMAKVIGGDVSAPEFASRVSTVVDRVQNSDPLIKAQLKAYYNIDDADLVKYYLNPDQNLAALKQKTLTAEIGAAGAAQGLGVQKTSAEALAAQGVTQQQAQQGYKTVAEVLPTATKLSGIYGENELDYGQAEAEADVFGTTGAASAQRKRRQMAALEAAAFGGRSGVDLENVSPLGSKTRGYSF